MLKKSIATAGTLALLTGAAFAADMPVVTKAPPQVGKAPVGSMFDMAFGGLVATDYNFRGVSQSDRGPSGGAYVEFQYNSPYGQWYLGTATWAIDWDYVGDPTAEVNFTGGWRHEWGKASVDIGMIYYYYPGEGVGLQSDFWEVYWKGGYAVTDNTSVGLNLFYTPDVLNMGDAAGVGGARGFYGALTASHTFWSQGDWSAAVSGELGRWWIKDKPIFVTDPSYTYWNAGISWTYKAVTLDLRYHDSDLGAAGCANFAGAPAQWCKSAFIASLKFDTSLSALK